MKRSRWFISVAVLLVFLASLAMMGAGPAGQGPVRKIVIFEPYVNEPAQKALVEKFGEVLKPLPLVRGMAVLLPPRAEVPLRGQPGVVRIDDDLEVQALPEGKAPKPTPIPPAETVPWGVDRIDADLVWPQGNTGAEIKVAVIDTGIDMDHPDLAANIKGGVNTINPLKSYDDDNGHGTHVAGTIAAVDNTIGVVGVAPQAWLYGVKVLNRQGIGFLSDVIEGLEWAIANKMQVVNMSIGGGGNETYHQAIKAVYDAGIVIAAAAGNNSGGAVVYPAAYPEVIAVSATDSNDKLASFSSVGPEVDLAAPGVEIPSTWKGGGYKTASGTSMACPHVAGTAALVIKSGIADSNGNGRINDEVQAKLESTAEDLGETGRDNLYGAGLVDAEKAVK